MKVPVVTTLHSSWPVCFRHALCYNEDGSCLERFVREVCSPCLARGRSVEKGMRVPVPVMSMILQGAWWSRRRVLRSVGRFIVPSATIARRLRESGFPAEQIVIIPHGLPTDDFRVRPRVVRPGTEGIHLLCVGRLEPGKGVQYLLQALRQVRVVHTDLTLTVVGDGSFRPELERLAASLDLTAMVRFVGAQPRSRLPDLYAEADLVVIPSLSEAFTYVALGAVAMGAPVVTTNVGGIPEILGDDAIFVSPMDSVALAHGILAALSDTNAAAARAAHARKRHLTRFGCDTMIDRIEAVYAELRDSKKLLGGNPRSCTETPSTSSICPK